MIKAPKWRVATPPLATIATLVITSTPAEASHDSLPCPEPSGMGPLFDLLHAITELAFLGGVGLGVLGFSVAGLLFMLPGPEYNRRGKTVAKNVFIGLILLFSANLVVGFIVNQMGGVVC